MTSWQRRWRYYSLLLTTGGLFAFNGCGLSDQQWSTIWQSVLTTALNTIVSRALAGAAGS